MALKLRQISTKASNKKDFDKKLLSYFTYIIRMITKSKIRKKSLILTGA